ncbi:TPA: hypothetical protein ACGPNR_001692 [Streptococcus agalactiae]
MDNLIRLAEIFDVSLDEHVLAKTNEVKVERIYEKILICKNIIKFIG